MSHITPILTACEAEYYKYQPAFAKQILRSFPIRLHSGLYDRADPFILRVCQNLILPGFPPENDNDEIYK
jgi:hypothetical protein